MDFPTKTPLTHFDTSSDDSYRNVDAVQNLSIVSHMAALGHGACGVEPNMDNIAATAQSFTDRARSELPCERHVEDDRGGDNIPSDENQTTKSVTNMELVKSFLISGFPLTLASIAQFSINASTVAIIGKFLGADQMGGATLALSLVNATGFAFGTGLCGALETVLSHTYGEWEKKKQLATESETDVNCFPSTEAGASCRSRTGAMQVTTESNVTAVERGGSAPSLYMYGTYTQRMILILLAAALPLGVILCFTDKLLKVFGESPVSIYYMGRWCRIVIFGLPVTLCLPLIQRYYSCQRVTKPLLVATFVAAAVHPGLQIAFIKLMGFEGSPMMWVFLMLGLLLGIIAHLRWTGLYRLTWGGWNKRSTQNLGTLVKLALPSMGIMMCEWVVVEIIALTAGFAPKNDLAAFSITLNIFGVLWGVTSGVIVIASVFVGNAIGGRKPIFARRIALISIVLVLGISSIDVAIMFALNPYIPFIFTNEQKVADIYQHIMYCVLPYHIVDTLQSVMMAILRGCGLQMLGAIIISIALCVVGLPLSFLLFFHFKYGVVSLWIGLFVGVGAVGTPLYLYILFRYIDWKNLKPHNEEIPHYKR
ncbi:unnamed protein product [Phytomonas sp. EM1]|nr:unnamed protein product [Phytomonas sp. EM1]|eukprot:CCW61436.1 unnamed protein product [Phytomonas sp. isolate EM1]